jgi:hypothetical protein
MEPRVETLENDMSMLKTAVGVMRATNASKLDVAAVKGALHIVRTDVAVIRENYATKQDLAALETRMLKWFIASTATVVATMPSIALAASRLML